MKALPEGTLIDAQAPGRIGIDVEQLGCGVGLEGFLDAIGRDLLRTATSISGSLQARSKRCRRKRSVAVSLPATPGWISREVPRPSLPLPLKFPEPL